MPTGVYERTKSPWIKGRHHTQKTKDMISETKKKNPTRYWLGKARSEETNEKIRKTLTGRKLSKEHVRKAANSHRGKHYQSEEWKEMMRELNRNRKYTKETLEKMSKAKLGGKSPNWKGGISSWYRDKLAERKWEKLATRIRKRDNRQCQLFGEYGNHVHHIIPYSESKDDNPSNLITLCPEHHGKMEYSKFQSFWRFYLSKQIKVCLN